jgi:hypothetical protein
MCGPATGREAPVGGCMDLGQLEGMPENRGVASLAGSGYQDLTHSHWALRPGGQGSANGRCSGNMSSCRTETYFTYPRNVLWQMIPALVPSPQCAALW